MADTYGEKSSTVASRKTTLCNFCNETHGICIAHSGHKVAEVTTRATHGAIFEPVRSQKGRYNEASDHQRCEFYERKTNVSVFLGEQRQGSAFEWPLTSHECLFDRHVADLLHFATLFGARRVPTGWFLGPSRAQAGQCDARVTSVCLRENEGSGCFCNR